MPLALGVVVLAGLGGYGACRLAHTPTRLVDGVHLRIMQPNLQQDVRFNYAAKQEVMNRYIALSDRASGPQSQGMRDVDASDLAGIVVSVFSDARSRCARRRSPICCRKAAVLITGAMRLADPGQSGEFRRL